MAGPVGCCRSALVGYRMHAFNTSYAFARAARSNLAVLDLIEHEAPGIPPWVLREGRARVVGYVAHLIKAGDLEGAVAILATIFGGQPLATARMCVRLVGHVVRETALGRSDPDPAIGLAFMGADPDSAPWGDHILMPAALRARLEALDRDIPCDLVHGSARLARSST